MPGTDVSPSAKSHAPLKPRDEDDGPLDLDDDDIGYGNQVANARRHDSIFVRAGEWLSEIWASVSQAFARLHEGIGNAAGAVARFFQRYSGAEEAGQSTMHIRTPLPPGTGAAASSVVAPSSPTVYFPIDAPPPAPPTVPGILGGIPQKRDGAVDHGVRQSGPPVIVAGQAAFNEWMALMAQGANAPQSPARYLDDPDCMTFARKVMKSTGEYTSRGISLPEDQRRLRSAAQSLLSAQSERRRQDTIAQQRAAREAERARKAEEARTAQPGQRDFEGLVAAYVRHRDDRIPFMIFDGSRFLRQDCLAYGNGAAKTQDERDALDYAKQWARNPFAAAERMRALQVFVTFADLDAADVAIANEKAALEAASFDALSTAPPPLPKPRWHAVLAAMPQWSNSELEDIGHVLGMGREQVRQAMEGLRSLVAGPLGTRPQAGNRVGYLLDYGSDAALRASATLEAIESASLLVSKLGGNVTWAEKSQAQTFFNQLQPVLLSVSDAIGKELDALLPARRQPGSERPPAIPSLETLSNEEIEEGGKMFERYVDAYKKFSSSVTYSLPRQSPYFKPECLAFAKTFVEQVGRMPQGAVVDTNRLAAAAYLLSMAQQQRIS